jgi:hypothetical protein
MTLALFIGSGIGLVYLLVHKHMEIVYGRRLIMKTLAHKADIWFHVRFKELGHVLSFLNKRNIARWINMFAVLVVRGVLALIGLVRKNTRGAVEKLSKTQETLKERGSASEYLRQIGETKNNSQSVIEKKED